MKFAFYRSQFLVAWKDFLQAKTNVSLSWKLRAESSFSCHPYLHDIVLLFYRSKTRISTNQFPFKTNKKAIKKSVRFVNMKCSVTYSIKTMFSGKKVINQFGIENGLRYGRRWLKTRTSATLIGITTRWISCWVSSSSFAQTTSSRSSSRWCDESYSLLRTSLSGWIFSLSEFNFKFGIWQTKRILEKSENQNLVFSFQFNILEKFCTRRFCCCWSITLSASMSESEAGFLGEPSAAQHWIFFSSDSLALLKRL